MKIDIAELPNIMRTLQQLTDAQRLVAATAAVDSDVRFDPCLTADDGQSLIPFAAECEISKAELLSIFQSRVEAHMKHLAQRYQIEFKNNFDGSQSLPVKRPAPEEPSMTELEGIGGEPVL